MAGAALSTSVALLPATTATATSLSTAANATATTAATTNPAAANPAETATPSRSFDPARGYVPGEPTPDAGTSASTIPLPPDSSPQTQAAAAQTPDANGGTLALANAGSVETAQGTPLTSLFSNGDALQVYGMGVVSRTAPDGHTLWQRGTTSLYRDWKASYSADLGYTPTPQIPVGTDPADPFYLTAAVSYAERNTAPYAVGDLTGDGVADVAVAETVGVNLGLASCGNSCNFAVDVPGSDLHHGTFVTVLDGRSGATVWHEFDPGFVPQLAISGGRLFVGDETGSPTSTGGLGAYGSQSTVRALTLVKGRTTTARVDWTWSTGSEWGLLLGLHPAGSSVAVTWSDTPVGLGTPGPPDGHVVLLDSRGRTSWDKRTPGYPTLSDYDSSSGRLAVVELTDPTVAIGYTLDALRISDGRTLSATAVPNVLPTTLTLGAQWLVAGVDTTSDQVSSPGYSYDSSSVSAINPSSGKVAWSRTLANDADGYAGQPGGVALAGGSVVVGLWNGSGALTPAQPYEVITDVQALSAGTGTPRWRQYGDEIDPLTLIGDGDQVRGVSHEFDAVTYSARTGARTRQVPLLANLYDAVSADVNGDGHADDIAGGQSGALYAFNGKTLTPDDDAPDVLWRADLGGPVYQIAPATVAGRAVLAVAAGTELDLVDRRTGTILHTMPLPGQYAWNVSTGTIGGRTVLVTGTDRLSAFDAATGKTLWAYRPTSPVYFSNASVVDGTVVTDYQSQVALREAPSVLAAVGIDGASGKVAWSAPQDTATTYSSQLWDGVIGGAGIPGAGPNGAAFAWQTADGGGRVDVRNAKTGALLYSNTDPNLVYHDHYLLDPGAGLIATGDFGAVKIAPAGPAYASPSGTGSALVTSGPSQVLLTAQITVKVYPMSVFGAGDDDVAPLATDGTYLAGTMSPGSAGQAYAMPINWLQRELLFTEMGQRPRPYAAAVQRGLEKVAVTGTAASTAGRHRSAAPNQKVTRPSTQALGDSTAAATRSGRAQPSGSIKIRGYDAAGEPQLTATEPSGYDPATIRKYLGLTGTGKGQTVAVVDAPGDSNLASDLAAFDEQFQLPAADLTIKAPFGTGTVNPNWGLETAMDVEWIHATAPEAAIVLVQSHDDSIAALFAAVDAAAALKPAAISLSWGLSIEFTDETFYDAHCARAGTICTIASGDRGWPAGYPSDNPAALAVGGTSLHLSADGTVSAETAWAGSGGGRSWVENAPAGQKGLVSTVDVVSGGRGVPDVSYVADPETGVAVYDTGDGLAQTGWFQVGGTSLGAPSWAAIIAATDQLRAAAGKSRLTVAQIYAARAGLGDITEGSNGDCPDGVCSTTQGYDTVTGLGSPRLGIDRKLLSAK
jgi:hypothetical protein